MLPGNSGLALRLPSGDGYQVSKGLRLSDCHLRQHLAVDGYPCLAQAVHEFTVFNPLGSAGGINPLNPESPHIALALASMGISVAQLLKHGFMGAAVERVSGCPLSFGQREHFLMSFSCGYT